MAWQPLGRNGRSLTADGSAVTTNADGLDDKPKLHKRPVIDRLGATLFAREISRGYVPIRRDRARA
jgi:hypothetical protein